MDKRVEELRTWRCDIQSAMRRMFNDEEFYLDCLFDMVNDPNFSDLMDALKKKDLTAAFDCAHALKGLLSNVGLTPMYNKVVEIVEPLRKGEDSGLIEKTAELQELRNHLADILKN